jgi:hypothetical protein
MKTRPPQKIRVAPGFALIVTLSLMILLTVVAVGLLTLSSISLRSTSQGEAMQIARANAKVALLLAIGDLQRQLGPDTRISATADQIANADGTESTTPRPQRQWSGAYESWAAGLPNAARPEPKFLQWFVSGDPSKVATLDFAATTLGTNFQTSTEIVTANTVGETADRVRVPLVSQVISNNLKNNFGWWVSDLGTKAHLAPAKMTPTGLVEVRADQQSAPATDFRMAATGDLLPFEQVSLTDPALHKVGSWNSSSLLADQVPNMRGLFHDLAVGNMGLLTNVRSGGFRKDLSMTLERPTPPDSTSTALYRVGGETGINLQELWAYYATPEKLTRSGSANFTTGGRLASSRTTPHFRVGANPAACLNDDWFYFKQPVIISYQMILSLRTQPVTVNGQTRQRLHLVADPVLTFWNPLDVPVVVPTYFSVKYWQIPYDLQISVNGGAFRDYPFAAILSGASTSSNADSNFMSLQVGALDQIVLKPGEVVKWSQTRDEPATNAGAGNRHRLGARKGFNFGGGVKLPVRDLTNQFVDLNINDSIRCQARPNGLTAGSTGSSGGSITGGSHHTRHFSLTHHEYYVGDDRGGNSVGIGNMAIDYDFGNRRLKPNELRSTGTQGTKPSAERLKANTAAFADVFPKIPSRDLPVFNLSKPGADGKQAFMILSFEAKTENGSDTRTRFLSRFNPNALHVDFYNLSEAERHMLPYEYRIEPLSSWKNRSIEVTTQGNAYYGGGMTASDGTSFVVTHSIPREPIFSLAAFQHSFANGFDVLRPRSGYAVLNPREPMLPQISHAIGNSLAPSVLAPDAVEGTLPGNRPLADHSYLANQALWDDWFLSGIAPQTRFTIPRTQKVVASDFLNNAGLTNEAKKLPVARYVTDLRGQDPNKLLARFFPGSIPTNVATDEIASYIRVEGMFNVNSTSVEAWKSVLGGLKNRPVNVREATGEEKVSTGDGLTSIIGLLAPEDKVAPSNGNADLQNPSHWVGRRTLDDVEIDRLARAIVQEVRKRGPFLSLADFINRRVGNNKDLARAGAIQSALDSTSAAVNTAYTETTGGPAFAFPEAETGPIAYGSPGVIKQADILTPIAPILSARSDSFIVRGYGERTDATGKVIARAWCEATVQRSAQFIDPTDLAEKSYSTITPLNRNFGRRFEIVSFRWLSPNEA